MTDKTPPDPFSYEERERTGRNAGLCIHPEGYDGECPCPTGCGCCKTEPAAIVYPHQDGEFTVLGPETFASGDGAVICWRGENYVRQPQPTPPQEGPHAPQDGPQRPDAGAETPDGAGGRQADADGRETLREQYAAALWQAAEFNIIAEWICCEPLNPRHKLCAQGYAAMRMIKALIVDDPEAAKPAPLAAAVLAVRDRELEELRNQVKRLGLMVDEYGAGAGALTDKITRVRMVINTHRAHLQLTDPILLAKLDKALQSPTHALDGGEQP